jgi:hypothetical protein
MASISEWHPSSVSVALKHIMHDHGLGICQATYTAHPNVIVSTTAAAALQAGM